MPRALSLGLLQFYFIFLAVFIWPLAAHASEKVVLQLKWENEFQFAGYYAALWQGFYERAGLNVEIRPAVNSDKSIVNPQGELLSGRADFAIGGLDILTGLNEDLPLVVLAPIFQKSPTAIIFLEDAPVKSLADLSKFKIAAPSDDYVTAEIKALFQKEGIDPDNITFLDLPPTIETLISARADAIVTYAMSGQFAATEAGVKVRMMSPSDYGISFYGDTLYTRQAVVDRDPKLVERFLKASVDGWVYALENREEIAGRIAKELPRHSFSYNNFLNYNLEFASVIDDYLLFPIVPIGNNNPHRWEKMKQLLAGLGMVKSDLELDGLFFSPKEVRGEDFKKILILLLLILLLFMFMLVQRGGSKPYLIPLLLISFIILATWFIENYRREQLRGELSLSTLQQLVSIREKLAGTLNKNVSLVSSFATYISLNPSLTHTQFETYAREMMRQEPLLINFAVAPGLVNQFIYPLEGNERALGLDYTQNKEQKKVVMQVISSGEVMVAGPVNLVQGGSAFIVRAPIFTGENDLVWGIVSAPVDNVGLYKRVGLTDPNLKIDIAIKGKDSLGEDGELFFGREDIFKDNPVTLDLRINNGSWHLAAVPKGGWNQLDSSIWAIRFLGLLSASLIGLLAIYRARQLSDRDQVTKELHRSENMLRHTGSMASIGGWEFDFTRNTIYLSDESYRIFGLENLNHLGNRADILAKFPEDIALLFNRVIDELVNQKETVKIESSYSVDDENVIWFQIVGEPVINDVAVNLFRGVVKDISENKKTERFIRYQAEYDSLTQLPNRSLFDDRLDQAIQKAHRSSEKFALLFMDLDDFKIINDTLGHAAGDLLLQQFSERIKKLIRASDTVARLSGDEFIVMIENIHPDNSIDQMLDKIISSLNEPFVINRNQVFTTASIGVTIFPDDGESANDLLKNADQAMYAAKASGRNNFHYFTVEMQVESDRRHRVYNDLIKAIAGEEFKVFYQPIIDLTTDNIVKCEALVRWFHPEKGVISPNEFIPIAESTGLISDIDDIVMRIACRDINKLSRDCGRIIDVAINKSSRDFHLQKKGAMSWLDEIKEYEQAPNITLEITESLLMDDDSHIMAQLIDLKDSGFSIAIDDFGTGYSSLSYLKRFPVDILKIDRAFINDVATNDESRALVLAILAMAKGLNLKVVAEGVETEEQRNLLFLHGCDYAQGYYFSKPLSFDDFRQLVSRS